MSKMDNQDQPVVPPPATADPKWAEKLEIAKAAREQGRALRAGKPMAFSSRRAQRTAQ